MIWIHWKRFFCGVIVMGALLFVLYLPTIAMAMVVRMHNSGASHGKPLAERQNTLSSDAVFISPIRFPRLRIVHGGLKLPLVVGQSFFAKSEFPEIPAKICMAWATFGLASAAWIGWDGRRRNPNFMTVIPWMLLSLVSPVLAIPFYVQFRPDGDLWPCRHCHSKYLLSLIYCPFCQKTYVAVNLQTGELNEP